MHPSFDSPRELFEQPATHTTYTHQNIHPCYNNMKNIRTHVLRSIPKFVQNIQELTTCEQAENAGSTPVVVIFAEPVSQKQQTQH